MPKFLYHYTSIETLALILKNKTMRLDSLKNVDDPTEIQSRDIEGVGKYILVSCWTRQSEESIPMWKMYSSSLRGVRIGMREFPFRSHTINKGEGYFTETCTSYFSKEILLEGNGTIIAHGLKLKKIRYTDNANELYPQVHSSDNPENFQRYLSGADISECGEVRGNLSFEGIGVCKLECWKFQEEERYWAFVFPMTFRDLTTNHSAETQRELYRRVLNKNTPAPYEYLDLELDQNALDTCEIMVGPRTSIGEKIIVQDLIEKYCPSAKFQESTVRING